MRQLPEGVLACRMDKGVSRRSALVRLPLPVGGGRCPPLSTQDAKRAVHEAEPEELGLLGVRSKKGGPGRVGMVPRPGITLLLANQVLAERDERSRRQLCALRLGPGLLLKRPVRAVHLRALEDFSGAHLDDLQGPAPS